MWWMRAWILVSMMNFVGLVKNFWMGDITWGFVSLTALVFSIWMFYYHRQQYIKENRS